MLVMPRLSLSKQRRMGDDVPGLASVVTTARPETAGKAKYLIHSVRRAVGRHSAPVPVGLLPPVQTDCKEPPLGFVFARPLYQRGRAVPLQDIHQNDLSAIGGDDLMADHLLARIVAALHKHARLD